MAKQWVEERGGHPATVKGTGGKRDGGKRIWPSLYQEEKESSEVSRFNKFVSYARVEAK